MTGEIRRIQSTGTGGYGVFGELVDDPTGQGFIYANRALITANDAYLTQRPASDTSTHTIVYLRWRWSVEMVDVNLEALKRYNNVLGTAQYGQCLMSAYDYVTDDVFLSYNRQKSAVYSCIGRFDGSLLNIEEPCDEPQEEFDEDEPLVGGFMGYSFDQFVPKDVPGSLQNFYTTKIADAAVFSCVPAVNVYRIGATFIFRVFGFTEEQWNAELEPPRLIF